MTFMRISYANCLELDTSAPERANRRKDSRRCGKKSTIIPLSFGFSATFQLGVIICLALANAPKKLYLPRFCC